MKRYRVAAFILSALLLIGCEPVGPVPGTRLDGQDMPPPGNWLPLNTTEVIQLSTFDNYSVNLWGVATDQGYYVASSRGPESKWASRITRNANVRLRIEGNIYPLSAAEVTDTEELEVVRAAFKRKYDLDADEDFPDAVVYRMDPRE